MNGSSISTDDAPGTIKESAQQPTVSENCSERSCLLVGEGNMLVASGILLQQAGFQISGVISDDGTVQQWARSLGLRMAGHGPDLVAWLESTPVDYLLSVINLRILPLEALRLPRIAAINFHDGPLPRYAGLHATSWALISGEKNHGVTWHLNDPSIDTGAIVRQRSFDVAEDETALTLNLKCFTVGLALLEEILPDLAQGTIKATQQDLSLRSYCAGSRRPTAGGILDWGRPGEESQAMARATDFGPYFNPLVLPKIWTGEECLIVREIRLGKGLGGGLPGTVLAIDKTSLTIATASRPLSLGGLATIDGQPLSVEEATRRNHLCTGLVLPALPRQCVAQVTSQSEKVARHEQFWKDRLQSLRPISLLGKPQSTQAVKGGEMVSMPWRVPEEVDGWLDRHGNPCQPEGFLLAAFGAFLARIGNQDRFDVEYFDGTSEAAESCSLLARHVPFCFNVDDDFLGILERVCSERALIAKHLTYPRDLVARTPGLCDREDLRTASKLSIAVEIGTIENNAGFGHDLVMCFPREGREGMAVFEGGSSDSMSMIVKRFLTFVRNLAAADGASLERTSIATDEERTILLAQWSSTNPGDQSTECLHHLFESQALSTPDAVALQCGTRELTYRELDNHAERLASRLRGLGVGAEVLVGICLQRSPEAIIGLLGILKAGGAYVPLDPAYPRNRLDFILGDSDMQAIVTLRNLSDRLPAGVVPHVYLDADELFETTGTRGNPVDVSHRNLAYIIYTSGTTGKPKGVMVEHRSVVNFVRAAQTRYEVQPGERVLQFASIAFDASIEEIFVCLSSGGTLVLRSDEMLASARQFMEQCAAWRINILDIPTAYWHLLVMQMKENSIPLCPDLRLVIIGGEAASPSHVATWRGMAGHDVVLTNTYGPTEATVVSTWVSLDICAAADDVPIGMPISGATVHVLDRWGQPLPDSMIGHLHIGGAGLARGYLNNPGLTAEKFIPNPFSSDPTVRLYRSGDLARWNPDGTLSYLGRIDQQIKLRGFRIEPGEIEAALLSHPAVAQAVVVLRNDDPSNPRLIAYWVQQVALPSDQHLRAFLAERLPDYMVPAAFVELEVLPLNTNGKLDRNALPAPDLSVDSSQRVEPSTDLERQLHAIWAEALGHDEFGIGDNFFAIGGHSLAAARLMAAIEQQFAVALPIATIFHAPQIGLLAELLERSTVIPELIDPCFVPLQREGQAAPLFVIHGYAGDVFCYTAFSDALAPTRPVYGLQARGIDGQGERHRSLQEMAEHYADLIERHRPNGELHLLGQSAGGWYAWAVASVLVSRGRSIGMVAILDSGPTAAISARLRASLLARRTARRLPTYLHLLRHSKRPRNFVAFLSERRQKLAFHLSWFQPEAFNLPRESSQPLGVAESGLDYFDLLHRRFRPVCLPLRVHLFTSRDDPCLKDHLWRALACRGVVLRQLFEDHHHFHHSSLAGQLSAAIAQTLEQIEGP